MIKITKANEKAQTLAYIGHVDNVINGIVPEELKNRLFFASDFDYGFELGSPQKMSNLGECILLNDILYASRTDSDRHQNNSLIWGSEFMTTGIFVVPQSTPVSYIVTFFSVDNKITLADLYREIYETLQLPFAAVGCIELGSIFAQRITHPPIHQENIFKNPKKYYQDNEYVRDNVNLAMMAVVSDPADRKISHLNEKLSSVLYNNPFAKKNNLLTHTHGLILNQPLVDIEKVQPKHAESVYHVQDKSILRYANLKIYTIQDLTKIA